MPSQRLFFLVLGAGGYVAWLITFFSTTFFDARYDRAATMKPLADPPNGKALLDSMEKLRRENAELKAALKKQGLLLVSAERSLAKQDETLKSSTSLPCACSTTTQNANFLKNRVGATLMQSVPTSVARPMTCGLHAQASGPCGLNMTRGTPVRGGRNSLDDFKQKGLLFLRIQKTAGTTFEQVLKSECASLGVTCGSYWHLERNMIARNAKGRVLVTWLRDPVERVASEWGYIRNAPGYQWQQPQWDFSPELQSLLHLWRHPPDGGEQITSLSDFVALPGNPANNRQVLYLLGFDRPDIFDCDHIRAFGGTWDRWQTFFSQGGISPGRALRDVLACGMSPSMLLELAKHRLEEEIHYYGLAECFNASLSLMAPQLGWNLTRTLHVASVRHRADGGDLAAVGPAVPWRHRLRMEEITAIESANSLDMELYTFAKQLLQRRLVELNVREKCL